MRLRLVGSYLFVVVTLLCASGCYGNGSAAPSVFPRALVKANPAFPHGVRHDYPTSSVLLFESDLNAGQVAIYPQTLKANPAPIAAITDSVACPFGAAMDGKGTLYVANNCASTVTEYPKGQTTHSVSITVGISNPIGLAISRHGKLFVSNSSPPAISEYPFGKTLPSKIVGGAALKQPFGIALDSGENLYIADPSAGHVFELAHGASTVTQLNLQDVTYPIGVAFDPSGNLWVTDGHSARVYVYPPGSQTPSQSLSGFTFPYAISIDAKGEVVISNTMSPLAVYAYRPGKFTPFATLTNGIEQPTGLLIRKP